VQVVKKLQLGEADVEPIDLSEHVAKDQKRQQPPCHLSVRALLFQRSE